MKKNLRIPSMLLALAMSLCLLCACTPEAPENSNTNTVTITVDVVNSKGETKTFPLQTEKETLADALLEANLVEGDDGPYGLYIKSVNGESADYATDGAYWCLYVGDQMAVSGASDIKIADGDRYKLVYTKA